MSSYVTQFHVDILFNRCSEKYKISPQITAKDPCALEDEFCAVKGFFSTGSMTSVCGSSFDSGWESPELAELERHPNHQ